MSTTTPGLQGFPKRTIIIFVRSVGPVSTDTFDGGVVEGTYGWLMKLPYVWALLPWPLATSWTISTETRSIIDAKTSA